MNQKQKTRILINGFSALQGGGQTYLINLLKGDIPDDIFVVLLINKNNYDVFKSQISDQVKIVRADFASHSITHRVIWERFKLPSLLTKLKISIYFSPAGIINFPAPKHCRTVVTFQNMLPFSDFEKARYPISYTRFRLFLLSLQLKKSFERADFIIFISKYAQKTIKNLIPSIDKKSNVIPHGIASLFHNKDSILIKPKEKYFVYVSILDVYKSQLELIECWNILVKKHQFDYKLKLVGPMYKPYGKKVLQKIKDYNLEDHVEYLGQVEHSELPALYHNSSAIIFASSCENCPNILLESMASKKIVYCSNFQPMPEFAKDSVIYFNPYAAKQFADLILNTLESESSEQYPEKAYNEAIKYNWEKCRKDTFDLFKARALN